MPNISTLFKNISKTIMNRLSCLCCIRNTPNDEDIVDIPTSKSDQSIDNPTVSIHNEKLTISSLLRFRKNHKNNEESSDSQRSSTNSELNEFCFIDNNFNQ